MSMGFEPDKFFADQKALKRTMTIDKYRNDAVVIRTHAGGKDNVPPSDTRESGAPSRRSLNNLVFFLNNSDVPMITMATLTIQKDVSIFMTVKEHKKLLLAFIQRLRYRGNTQYIWVREFTKKGIPHWHIFCDLKTKGDGIDVELSKMFSAWSARYIRKICKDQYLQLAIDRMEFGDGKDFYGCVQVERLRSDAAGAYAGKEGGKRFQKLAPKKWRTSGTWWDKSRNIVCTAIERIQVRTSSLQFCQVKTEKGEVLDIPYKHQFGRGKSIEVRKRNKSD